MAAKKPSGARAYSSGKRLENGVSAILDDHDYSKVKKLQFNPVRELEQPIYAKQYEIGKDVYGKRRRVDFILYHPRLCPDCLVIQCKQQSSPGSVEQKYPYEVLSIQENDYDTIIVLDDGGYSEGAKEWLINQVGATNRLKHVFDCGEFERFVKKNL